MGRKSSGVAKAGLITGIVGSAGALLNNNNCGGLLSNLFGGNNNCHATKEEVAYAINQSEKMAAKDAEIAMLKADRSTDTKILELYQYTETQFKERDTTLTGALIELGKESVRNEYARADIAALKVTVAEQGKQICELNSSVSTLSERVTGVASTLSERIRAQGEATAAAINLEAERRECADNSLRCYVDATFVPGKLVMPLDAICPEAMPRCATADAVRVETVK